jgi:hypothetical protein
VRTPQSQSPNLGRRLTQSARLLSRSRLRRPGDRNGDRALVPRPIRSGATTHDWIVANAMADSEHAPMSEAIVGTTTGLLAIASNAGTDATRFSRRGSVADRKLAVLGGGLGERLLQCALAAGLAGNRQLRGPSGDAADERCGALAARDLYRRTLTELSEQPGAVLLR